MTVETLPAPHACATNSASNTYPPGQVRPTASDLGAVVGFHIGVWPEGVEVDVGDPAIMKPTPAMTVAFEKAKKLLPNPIPMLLAQSPCCTGGAILTIRFADGQSASYGPCVRPDAVDEIISLLYAAFG